MNDNYQHIIESLKISTPEAVMTLKPGLALDSLTAVKVLGWEIVDEDEEQPNDVPYVISQKHGLAFYPKMADEFPYLYPMIGMLPYSNNIGIAWEVVEEMAKTNHWTIVSPFERGGKWFAGLTPLGSSGFNGKPDFWVESESAPEAICKAALLCKIANP